MPALKRWGPLQVASLEANANKGADGAREAIFIETGVLFSVAAVQQKAHKLGVSLLKEEPHETCSECGGFCETVNRDGLCNKCRFRKLRDKQERANRSIRREIERNEQAGDVARREYQAAKKRRQREGAFFV